MIEGSRSASEPYKGPPNGEEQNDCPSYSTEQDVHSRNTRISIDKRQCQCKQDPSDDIISDSRGEDDYANLVFEQFGAGKDTTQDRKRGDAHSDTDEEHEMAKRSGRLIDIFVVDGHRDGRAKAERQNHTGERYDGRVAAILLHDRRVDFEADQEEEEDQADVGDEVKVGDGLLGEDAISKVWDTAHNRWSEDDTSNDLGDDFWLFDQTENPSQTLGEDDNDG